MHRFLAFCLLLSLLVTTHLPAQRIAELEESLRQASTPDVQADLHLKLAKNWLVDNLLKADTHAQHAVALAIQIKNKNLEAEATLCWADIAHRRNQPREAISRYTQAWEAASGAAAHELALEAVEQLQTLTEKQGDFKEAYRWSRERSTLLQLRSRIYLNEQLRKHETIQAELAAQKKRETHIWLGVLAGAILVMSLFNYFRQRSIRRTRGELANRNAMIEDKRRRSEQLLLNILPPAVAAELTLQNKVAARRYERTTVMFVDFVRFTHIAEQLQPEELVQELDYCFSHFDSIVGRLRLEKIKTVGDAYICASGLSDGNEHPGKMIRAALQMQEFLLELKARRSAEGRPHFEARIGIHLGPVVAGVVGVKKFAYDIWGDTVNTAARIEEACEPGRVNVSLAAQALAREEFQWEYRGKVATKNKAEMDMYYVSPLRPNG